MAPGNTISDYPTSFNLPPEMRARLLREAAKRGGLPLGPMLRLVIQEWISVQDKRTRRQKKQDKQLENGDVK